MRPSSLLRTARRRAGLSQRALAQLAGFPQSTVGRIEAGLIDPRTRTLSALLGACGCELELQPRLGDGVDRTQIQELLAISPSQRIERAVAAAASIGRIRGTARKRK